MAGATPPCSRADRDGTADLHDRIAERLAALARDLPGEVIASGFHQGGNPAQDGNALVRLQPTMTIRKGPRRCLQLRLECDRIVGRDLGDGLAVERLHDLQHARSPA